MLSNSLAGEVVGLGVTFTIGLVLFCSFALLVVVWYWETRYAPTGIVSRRIIYVPNSKRCLKVENIVAVNSVYLNNKVGN